MSYGPAEDLFPAEPGLLPDLAPTEPTRRALAELRAAKREQEIAQQRSNQTFEAKRTADYQHEQAERLSNTARLRVVDASFALLRAIGDA